MFPHHRSISAANADLKFVSKSIGVIPTTHYKSSCSACLNLTRFTVPRWPQRHADAGPPTRWSRATRSAWTCSAPTSSHTRPRRISPYLMKNIVDVSTRHIISNSLFLHDLDINTMPLIDIRCLQTWRYICKLNFMGDEPHEMTIPSYNNHVLPCVRQPWHWFVSYT